MKELDKIKYVFLLGIGGIGMSGLARYFKNRNCIVSGYDKTETPLTKQLVQEGISIIYVDDLNLVQDPFKDNSEEILIIYTPAIPVNNSIFTYFVQQGNIYKRSQVLGIISEGMYTIAVAGTHGKTTTSTIITHLLKSGGIDCTAFLGGISTNYHSNFLIGDSNVMVVEADEYDRSFLTLHPDVAVITSMDADHLDIYGNAESLEKSFQLFASQLKEGGQLFVKLGLDINQNKKSYSVINTTDIYADNIKINDGNYYFDFHNSDCTISNLTLGLAGMHNVENAVVAIAVALSQKINEEDLRQALKSYSGVKRRFEYIIKSNNQIYIDDYAHHPTEIEACINSVKQLYPNKKLTVVFQPHLFTRTRDFASDFAISLSVADQLILLNIYPARELPIEGITSQMLLDLIQNPNKVLVADDELVATIHKHKPELLLTLGAGDIDRFVEPLKLILS